MTQALRLGPDGGGLGNDGGIRFGPQRARRAVIPMRGIG